MKKLYKLLSIIWSLKNSTHRRKFLLGLHSYLDEINTPLSNEKSPYQHELLKSTNDYKILLVVHELSNTGVPYAVLYLANALYSIHGIKPIILSPKDGFIRNEFTNAGFLTIIDPSLFNQQNISIDAYQFVTRFEKVIVTSLACFHFIENFRGIAKNLIWWIHETAAGFNSVSNMTNKLPILFMTCQSIWLGSPQCFPFALQYTTKDKLHLLLYGCNDGALPHQAHASEKMVFSIIGSIEPRKGHDIFLTAIKNLSSELKAKALFRIIGSPLPFKESLTFYQAILHQGSGITELEFIQNIPQEQLLTYYAENNVLVSASRDDPMPIVVTQGLMFSNICLCSSAIGHAQLLDHGKNGLLFETESSKDLTEKITWLLQQDSNERIKLGTAGRSIYEHYFLMDNFIKNVKNLL